MVEKHTFVAKEAVSYFASYKNFFCVSIPKLLYRNEAFTKFENVKGKKKFGIKCQKLKKGANFSHDIPMSHKNLPFCSA